jgi:hypothetical protein
LEHPSWAGMDHLKYLQRKFSIFKNEEDRKILEHDLYCAECGLEITKVNEKIEIFGRHDHSFGNLGFLVQLGCYRNASGCNGVQGVSHGYSWFRGFAWQIQVCKKCYTQLGWKYMSEEESFYGLIFNTLREEEEEAP